MKVWSMVIAVVIGAVGLGVRSSADAKLATADTLRHLEGEFVKAAAEKGSEGYMSYYAEDAVEVPNGEDAIQGKANIAKTKGFLGDKKNQLVMDAGRGGYPRIGGYGYTWGAFEFRSKDKDGKPVVEHCKYTSIWKKQKDGTWKVVLDMGMRVR